MPQDQEPRALPYQTLYDIGQVTGLSSAKVQEVAAHLDAIAPRPAELMREFIADIAKQIPEKPDYWSSCGQCDSNINRAEDILEKLAAPKAPADLPGMWERADIEGGATDCAPAAPPSGPEHEQYLVTPPRGLAPARYPNADGTLPAPPSAPASELAKARCNRCKGSGMVDDGEITGSGGVEYENGPVKCVKDCPACGGSGSLATSAPASESEDAEWIASQHAAIKQHHSHAFETGVSVLHPDCISDALRKGLSRGRATGTPKMSAAFKAGISPQSAWPFAVSAPASEPVGTVAISGWNARDGFVRYGVLDQSKVKDGDRLYLAPTATSAPAEPLSDEQISNICERIKLTFEDEDFGTILSLARAIEAAVLAKQGGAS